MIEEMTLEHLDGVLKIENSCFPSGTWSRDAYIHEISNNEFSKLYVYKIEDRIVGVCGTYIIFDQAQIITIGVDPEYRGQGIARAMMDKMNELWIESDCEFCTLEVRVSNESAIKLYESYGFIEINIRKSYYEDGENAYVMGKAVGGTNE